MSDGVGSRRAAAIEKTENLPDFRIIVLLPATLLRRLLTAKVCRTQN
jgi:hypothetical protein